MRIASLIPSGTDIAASLGLADALVGVSHECDHPAAAGLPVLTASTVGAAGHDVDGPDPADIDRQVVDAVTNGRSLYTTEVERLRDLRPDVVLSQDVCDVCAVDGALARASLPDGAELVMLEATNLVGLMDDVRRVGKATGREGVAEQVIAGVRARLQHVSDAVAAAPRPRVVTVEWTDPPFLGGHWVPELVEAAGGEHLLSSPGDPSRRATWDEIAEADPDIIVVMPCGYTLEVAVAETRQLVARPEVASLRAVRDGALWVTAATRLFSRCTPDAVTAGAAVLGGILHPDRLPSPPPTLAVRLAETGP
ncbi:MAG TPA: ABC transporter substrate-binding protein [Egibacteraceae bacterium]|nr:ABC transporter substrate-binding protein [Egibacteraceae bacterium]